MENDAETKKTSLQGMAIKAIVHNLNRYNRDIMRSLPPMIRGLVVEYINAGGIASTRNVNCSSAVLGLLNKYITKFDHRLLDRIESSQEMTSEEITQHIDEILQSISGENATIQRLDLYYYFYGRSFTITQSSFDAILTMRRLSYLCIGDLQIELAQFVRITVEIATLNLIEARRVTVDTNSDLGVLVSTCDRFVFQKICYEGTNARGNFIHFKMKTDLLDLTPPNELPVQILNIIYLKNAAQLEMLGKLSHLTNLMVRLPWYYFQAEELTDDRLPSWPRLKFIDITGSERTNCVLYLRRLLEKYGSGLEGLSMRRFDQEFSFELLFNLCRNLFALEIDCCHVTGEAPVNFFNELCSMAVTQSANYSPIKIASFLFAPRLLYLTLLIADVDPSDLANVMQQQVMNPHDILLPSLRHLAVQPLTHEIHQNFDVDGALNRINILRNILQALRRV